MISPFSAQILAQTRPAPPGRRAFRPRARYGERKVLKTVMKCSLLAAVAAAPLLAGTARADYSAATDESLPVGSPVLNQDMQAAVVFPAGQGLVLNREQEHELGRAYHRPGIRAFEDILNYPSDATGNNNSPQGKFSFWVSGENGDSKCILTLHIYLPEGVMRVGALNDPGLNFVLPAKIDLRQFNHDGIRFAGDGQDNSAPWLLDDQPISLIGAGRAVLDACAPTEVAQSTHRRVRFRIERIYFEFERGYFVNEGEYFTAARESFGIDFPFDGAYFAREVTHFVHELVYLTRDGYFAREGAYLGSFGSFGSFAGAYFGSVGGPGFEGIGRPGFAGVGGLHTQFRAR